MRRTLQAGLIAFAARNIFRHRARSAVTLGAIAFGVAALIVSGGFVEDLYRQLGEALIRSQSGHMQVAMPSFFAEGSRSPEKHRIADVEAVKRELAALPEVKAVSARLAFSGLLNNSRKDVPILGEGIEPQVEREMMTSIRLVAGRMLEARDRAGVLIGEGLADELGLRPGNSVIAVASTVGGAINSADLQVVGVFRSFSREYDARAMKLPLKAAQELLDTPDANTLVVLLSETDRTDDVGQRAQRGLQARGLTVRTWQELNEYYRSTVELFDRQFSVLRVIILFMVALGVGNAVNMTVFERIGEFGTMRALGNRSGDVTRLVLLECVLLGCAGAMLGVLAGVGVALAVSAIGIPMPPPPNSNIGYLAAVRLVPAVLLESFTVGLLATIVAGVLPARRAGSLAIAEALRRA